MLLGFIGGADADQYTKLGDGERRERVLNCYARLFGEQAPEPAALPRAGVVGGRGALERRRPDLRDPARRLEPDRRRR